MAKLNASYVYTKGGGRTKNAYRLSLQKVMCEKYGFDENTDIEIIYGNGKIVIQKKYRQK